MNDQTNQASNDQAVDGAGTAAAATELAPSGEPILVTLTAPDAAAITAADPAHTQGILGKVESELSNVAGEIKEFFGVHPTPAEARAMFLENPGLANVVTTEGKLHRNGVMEPIPAAT